MCLINRNFRDHYQATARQRQRQDPLARDKGLVLKIMFYSCDWANPVAQTGESAAARRPAAFLVAAGQRTQVRAAAKIVAEPDCCAPPPGPLSAEPATSVGSWS